ncbi:unnamed protein product [Oreochromis niloticus]|nr:unnamed protein product [Mustela putorius furo]
MCGRCLRAGDFGRCHGRFKAGAQWWTSLLHGVELYTHQSSVKNIFSQLAKWNFRLTAVHLVDSHYCADPAKFISVLCTSLSTMLHVELPHVNVLSKMDLMEQYGKLAFNLDFYTEVMDLTYLLDHLAADPFFKKFRHLNEKLAEVVQDYSLVSFVPLNVQDKESMIQVLQAVDKANGYCFGDLEERNLQAMMSAAVGADFQFNSYPFLIVVVTHGDSSGLMPNIKIYRRCSLTFNQPVLSGCKRGMLKPVERLWKRK